MCNYISSICCSKHFHRTILHKIIHLQTIHEVLSSWTLNKIISQYETEFNSRKAIVMCAASVMNEIIIIKFIHIYSVWLMTKKCILIIYYLFIYSSFYACSYISHDSWKTFGKRCNKTWEIVKTWEIAKILLKFCKINLIASWSLLFSHTDVDCQSISKLSNLLHLLTLLIITF